MNPSRVGAIVLRQVYLMRSSPQRVIPLVGWAAIDIVLWGFLTRYLNGVSQSGIDFVPALLGAVLMWNFVTRVMQGVTMAFFEDVWTRSFLNLFASPLTVAEYLGGLVMTAIATSLIGLLVMGVLSTQVFGLPLSAYGWALIPFLLVLFLFGIALGVASVALVLRLGPASEWLIWPIPSVISPFVGVYYPIAILPAWVQPVSRLLPPSYVFEAMRTVARGGPVPWGELMLGAGLAALYVVLAWLTFRAVHRFALRTGLIARYTAETAS